MKSLRNQCSRTLSVFILISLLLCSIFSIYHDLSIVRDCDVLIAQRISVLELSGVSEFINIEEITVSPSQAVMIRQLFSRRSRNGTIWTDIIGILLAPVISMALLAFLILHKDTFQKSQSIITAFIHNKDGKKSSYSCIFYT